MAHAISSVSGRSEVFVAGKPAWHGLGVRVDEAQTAEAAIGLAGLDWTVHQRPLHLPDGASVPDKVANVRSAPDGADVYLGTVGTQYRPIQNHEAFSFMDEVVGLGEAIFETAGAIKHGRRVWLLARLPENLRVDSEDEVKKYLLLANGHDGSMSCRVFWTPVRVVCNNTLTAALGRRSAGDGITIRHSGNVRGKLDEARRILGLARSHYDALGSVFRKMKKLDFDLRAARDFFEALVPEAKTSASTKSEARVHRVRSELLAAYRLEANELAGRSVWAAYNAATRWSDHIAFQRRPSATPETRFENVVWGGGKQFKQAAFDLALTAIGGAGNALAN